MSRLSACLTLCLLAAPLPALAQIQPAQPLQLRPLPQPIEICKTQTLTADSQISFADAVQRWSARADSQHGAVWRQWDNATDRNLYTTNPGNGTRYVVSGRPCRINLN